MGKWLYNFLRESYQTMLARIIVLLLFIFSINSVAIANIGAMESKSIIACAEPWPPFDYQKNGQVKGKDVELNKAIFQSLNVPAKIIIMPWKQCWQFIQSGKVDVAFMVSKRSYRERDAFYSAIPTNYLDYVWVTNSTVDQARVCQQTQCDQLVGSDLKLGVVAGNSYSRELAKCFSELEAEGQLVKAPTLSAIYRMLLMNKVQLVPSIDQIAQHVKDSLDTDDIKICKESLFSKNYYTVFSKKSHYSSEQYENISKLKVAFDQALKDYLSKD
ncbi:transporter substrate-binding domain-containing protein [Thiotrichales bacterium 19S9-12]|nr:transporter substrate-binding domain-containing protein [Thiotrichales bacterium 19S9-12]